MMWRMRGEHGAYIASGDCVSNRIELFSLMKGTVRISVCGRA